MQKSPPEGVAYVQELIECFGAQMLATARRYSWTDDDADDAYQRAAEIATRHRPTGSPADLQRWLRTTAKHEALAIRRQRGRTFAAGEPERLPAPPGGDPPAAPDAHERAELRELLRHGGQALDGLKPQELRALRLQVNGHSYKEICAITGWTYTKVNRCLTEGRRALRKRMAAFEDGAECERLVPLLEAVVRGEAARDDVLAARPHLLGCARCRGRLRALRRAAASAPALAPASALAPAGPSGDAPDRKALGSLLDWIGSALQDRLPAAAGHAQERATALGDRLHQLTELAAGQKALAAAASAAAITGGMAAVERDGGAVPRPVAVRAADQRDEHVPDPLGTSARSAASNALDHAPATATPDAHTQDADPIGASPEPSATTATSAARAHPGAGAAKEFGPETIPDAPQARPAATQPSHRATPTEGATTESAATEGASTEGAATEDAATESSGDPVGFER